MGRAVVGAFFRRDPLAYFDRRLYHDITHALVIGAMSSKIHARARWDDIAGHDHEPADNLSTRMNAMAHALNLTLKIKQDPATLQRLAGIKAVFADQLQPK